MSVARRLRSSLQPNTHEALTNSLFIRLIHTSIVTAVTGPGSDANRISPGIVCVRSEAEGADVSI